MKLVTFDYKGQNRIGAIAHDHVAVASGNLEHTENLATFLSSGNNGLQAMQSLLDSDRHRLPLKDIKLLAPIPQPRIFLGVGLNYSNHIDETGRQKPEYPTFFSKLSSCIIGPGEPIICPKISEKVDYEGELAFVIGKRCRNVPIDKAREAIAGYLICNDVTVRDWQQRSPTWTLGKSFDSHGPLGPWLVTADEIGDPHNLALKTWVGDDLRQSANTREMLFNCYELLAYLSQALTLEPGDIITTGTPGGVGVSMKPRGYLKPGQTVRIEIERIGTLHNPVVMERDNLTI